MVYRCVDRQTKQQWAVKIITKRVGRSLFSIGQSISLLNSQRTVTTATHSTKCTVTFVTAKCDRSPLTLNLPQPSGTPRNHDVKN